MIVGNRIPLVPLSAPFLLLGPAERTTVGIVETCRASVGASVEVSVGLASLQRPKNPGDSQVAVELDVPVEDENVLVVSSRQPHHPGVLQVSVRVCVVLLDVVVVELLLSKYFHL